ncbi:DUF4183 domain-containing protein [Cohnella zeiphila]|uniref:DUF4183 domain-containing protein n=1 Tax=Cohnella zeiphila TaxID=2761120 RepID=A0A7X0SI74_9BACL|nr:DUF4183 domain-containing protein [Cohnella zeiphila]MBB6730422.1 DUF4183 domain-containing protein [Cohnella zeiphila]
MALQLMKLFVGAATTTAVGPDSSKYFYVTTADTAAGATLTIDAGSFFDDSGAAVTELPALEAGNSYFQVSVNGVLQMDGISTYTPGAAGTGSLAVAVPAGGSAIVTGTPVVLELATFAPTSTTVVTT